MLNYGIIGFGGLGKTHFGNCKGFCEKSGVKLVAICDIEEYQFETKTDTNLGADNTDLNLSSYNLYTDADEMFEKEQLDFVITALPTYIHEEMAVKAMKRGIHVFSEKPMALTAEQAENMLKVAKENNVKLMIGQCMRYAIAYKELKEMIETKKFGKVIKAEFAHISSLPIWGWKRWFLDEEKSGGCALDMHIHDVDYINYIFGVPKSVSSVATHCQSGFDSISTTYEYDDVVVTSKADWGNPAEYPFSETFVVRFENASVTYKNGEFAVYEFDKPAQTFDYSEVIEYLDEAVDFVACIKEDKESEINPAASSLLSLKIALAEKKSASTGEKVFL